MVRLSGAVDGEDSDCVISSPRPGKPLPCYGALGLSETGFWPRGLSSNTGDNHYSEYDQYRGGTCFRFIFRDYRGSEPGAFGPHRKLKFLTFQPKVLS